MNCESFFKVADQFKLGTLTTESIHPLTKNLSYKVNNNLIDAIEDLKSVDRLALEKLEAYLDKIESLYLACQKTFENNKRVFLCGCGATGRLSLTIEFIHRKLFEKNADQVVAFMAGGDFALIKSVESFEDRMSYGARQLKDLGFTDGDLLLAITEGGETSFVIGAAQEASKLSQNLPFFLYCNPDNELRSVKRSRDVLDNSKILKCNLTIGAMALSGSTRMQASTVQMFAAGMAVLSPKITPEDFKNNCRAKIKWLKELDYFFLKPFIEWESKVYQDGGIVTYRSDSDIAISLLTDTTERSPTFSLNPFEQVNTEEAPCLSYLAVYQTYDAESAWYSVLQRSPRGLDWSHLDVVVDRNEIYKFDISENAIERRSKSNSNHHLVDVFIEDNKLVIATNKFKLSQKINDCFLTTHLGLKLLMNTHSTLVMGKLHRYESNMMTWVSPSNYKLIDRAARYVMALASQRGKNLNYKKDYRKIVEQIFDQREFRIQTGRVDEAIVISVLNKILQSEQ